MTNRANKGSWNEILEQLEIGGRHYTEVELSNYKSMQRIINTPTNRRPKSLAGKTFSTQLLTAVSASKAGDVRYLICLERTA